MQQCSTALTGTLSIPQVALLAAKAFFLARGTLPDAGGGSWLMRTETMDARPARLKKWPNFSTQISHSEQQSRQQPSARNGNCDEFYLTPEMGAFTYAEQAATPAINKVVLSISTNPLFF